MAADAKATENLKIKLNYAVAELNTKSLSWYKFSESMEKAGEKMKSVEEKISSVGSKLSTAVTLPLVVIGTVDTKMAMDAYVENCHEAIIPKEIFIQFQEELIRRSTGYLGTNRNGN